MSLRRPAYAGSTQTYPAWETQIVVWRIHGSWSRAAAQFSQLFSNKYAICTPIGQSVRTVPLRPAVNLLESWTLRRTDRREFKFR
jgi:hypothetical protein